MAVTVKVINHMEVAIGNDLKEFGSRVTPQEVSVDGTFFECRDAVVNAADGEAGDYKKVTLWTTADGGLDTFDFLLFESDADVLLELRNTADTDQYVAIGVLADVPILLTTDDLLASDDGTAVLTDSTVASPRQIDQVSVQNNSAAVSTANVHLLLID